MCILRNMQYKKATSVVEKALQIFISESARLCHEQKLSSINAVMDCCKNCRYRDQGCVAMSIREYAIAIEDDDNRTLDSLTH